MEVLGERPLTIQRWVLSVMLLLFFTSVHSFYLPGVAPQDFVKGNPLKVKVNKLTSTKTQLPYSYYSLPYCKPEKIVDSAENLGEVLRGDRIENSPYVFKMREPQMCNVVCRMTLDAKLAKEFKEKIDDEYRVNMILDNLPLVVPYKRPDVDSLVYQYGVPVGLKSHFGESKEEKYFIYNHLTFTVKFHKDEENDAARIVGFEVKPFSAKHEYEGKWDDKKRLTTCDPHAKHTITSSDSPQEVEDKEEIIFTYDVEFKESEVKWASRWDTYLLMADDQIHWFSIVNSLMIVLFLSGMVAMIMLRTLYRDISKYNQLETQEEAQEETGWKLVHGDIFRPPTNSDLLCVYVGTGVQFFGMILVTMIFAALGFLSPSNRGGLMTAMLLLWAFMGLFAGYAAARLYKMFKGTEWKKITLRTAFTFPGIVFAIFFVLNALIWGEKSSGAVPFGTMFALVFLWFGISVPLVFVGSYVGFRKPAIEGPVKTNKIPRQIPEQAWYMNPVFSKKNQCSFGLIMEKNEASGTKKEPNYRGVKAMPFVIGNETFEKLGTIGTSANLLVYLSTVFNMSTISANNLINIFNGTCNFGTLFGAFLSDTYLGRYKILGIASISSFLGMLVLTLTAAVSSLHPPKCGEESSKCVDPTPWQLAFLFSSFALLVVGASGIRPCNLAFGADQFNPNTDSGRKGINSFFNWYYFTFTFAMMISLTLIVYVQANINWAIGLGIPTFLMFLSCAFFFIGSRIYVKVLPEGSPLTSMARALVVAFKKRKLNFPEQPWSSLFNYHSPNSINSKLAYSDQLRFLNKAAIITEEDEINTDGSAANPWCLCSIQQVEEVKCVIRVIPMWIAGIIYYVVLAQMQTYVVFQAIQSDRHLGSGKFQIPAATYAVFSMLSLTIWIPIYDRLIVPLLRRITRKEEGISLLQRIGIGMVLAIVTMLVSALVETKRRTLALTHPTVGLVPRKGAISSMSGSWLIPQLAIAGISEAFTVIGQVEFFYKQFPENMRSFAGSFLFCGFAMSSYLSSFLISVVHRTTTRVGETENWLAEDLNRARLDYFYYLVAGLEVVNLGYFLICSKYYKYKTTENDTKDVAMEELKPQKSTV